MIISEKYLKEKQVIEMQELYEDMDLVEEWVGQSLEHIQDELSEYIYESEDEAPEIKKKKKPEGWDNPFKGTGEGFKEMFGIGNPFKKDKNQKNIFVEKKLKGETKSTAKKLATTLYNTYKKTHKMLAW